jgi:hypothetical protein
MCTSHTPHTTHHNTLTLNEIGRVFVEPPTGDHVFHALGLAKAKDASCIGFQFEKLGKELDSDLFFVVLDIAHILPTVNDSTACLVTHVGDHFVVVDDEILCFVGRDEM